MPPRSSTPHSEAPKCSFTAPSQAEEWKAFYTGTLDFCEALDMNPDEEDQGKRGWNQIKMIFEGKDHQALQILIDNKMVTPKAQRTPALALRAIQSVIKGDADFCITAIKSFQIYDSSQTKVYTPSQTESAPSSANASSPMKM